MNDRRRGESDIAAAGHGANFVPSSRPRIQVIFVEMRRGPAIGRLCRWA